jgi:hypothetical protein
MTDAGQDFGSHGAGGLALLTTFGLLGLFWAAVILEVSKLF